jgi:hypothetical protein
MQPFIRVSDADRQHVVDLLQRHTTAGRLSLDEFGTRVDAANRAVTRQDLAVLTADLPTEPTGGDAQRFPLRTTLIVAGTVVALLVIVAVVAGLAGWSDMGPMMGH